jgi:hypothetical protein
VAFGSSLVHIGMVTRNERNAIIQHGTMSMVRRGLLEQLRWSRWCVTDDAELGLPGHWIGEAGTARALPIDCGVATAPSAEHNATSPPIARQHT